MYNYTCDCGREATIPKVPTVLRCSCGLSYDVTEDNATIRPDPPPRDGPEWIPESPCERRGRVLRQMEGRCCNGRTIVDVFECSVHGECTYRNTKAGDDKPHVCLGCDDHTSR